MQCWGITTGKTPEKRDKNTSLLSSRRDSPKFSLVESDEHSNIELIICLSGIELGQTGANKLRLNLNSLI
jgi:hypothetical protein